MRDRPWSPYGLGYLARAAAARPTPAWGPSPARPPLPGWGGPGWGAAGGPRGRLVSVAGSHVVSAEFAVGATGNVLTHADSRGRGLASATTTAVAMALA